MSAVPKASLVSMNAKGPLRILMLTFHAPFRNVESPLQEAVASLMGHLTAMMKTAVSRSALPTPPAAMLAGTRCVPLPLVIHLLAVISAMSSTRAEVIMLAIAVRNMTIRSVMIWRVAHWCAALIQTVAQVPGTKFVRTLPNSNVRDVPVDLLLQRSQC